MIRRWCAAGCVRYWPTVMILTFVGEAVDGRDAVAVVTRTRPDVVLMDVRMPGVDGIAAARKITTDSRLSGVAIIMLTTFDEDDQDLCGDPGRGFRRAVRRKAITSVAFSEWVPGPAISTVMSVLTATTEKLLSTPLQPPPHACQDGCVCQSSLLSAAGLTAPPPIRSVPSTCSTSATGSGYRDWPPPGLPRTVSGSSG
jgi:CheY-like chemotaxis protein